MVINEIINRLKFFNNVDRLGPDMLTTHFKLHLKSAARKICLKKFKKFGENSEFRPGAYAISCSKISIGDNVIIRPNCMLFADPRKNGAEIIIEDNVLIGSNVHMYVNNHEFSNTSIPIIKQGHSKGKNIHIKNGAWIGAGCIILSGVSIGENAVIGAGSVVTKDVPEKTVYAGNPAKKIKYLQ